MTAVLIAPPYSGPTAVCTQCGHIGASSRCVHYPGLGLALQRNCGRCAFAWTERPATTDTAATGQYV